MNLEDLRHYCLSKKETTESLPFDKNILVFKVCNKMFALSSLQLWEQGTPSINLKCDPDYAVELRASYNAVTPGHHMDKRHWITVEINTEIPTTLLKQLILDSYLLVVSKLPKKQQNLINP